MDKETYLTFLAGNMAPEMRPFLSDLIVPCDCGAPSGHGWRCMGWRLRTMIRAQLPPEARARRSKRDDGMK